MTYLKMLFVFFFSLVLQQTIRAQEAYRIDPNQSTISFSVKHMVINTVHGKFTDYIGTIEFDENDLTKSSVNVTIKTASLNTEVAVRDNDLRSPNFLDVAKYPEIIFISRRVQKDDSNYVLVGDLTIHGVTKQVNIPFRYNGKVRDLAGSTRLGFEGALAINRQEWGINYNKVVDNGGLVAGNEVKIELDIEAVKK